MMVKKTWRNKLTAFMSTENRKSHASPDILMVSSYILIEWYSCDSDLWSCDGRELGLGATRCDGVRVCM